MKEVMKKIFSLLLAMVFSVAVLPLNVLGASAEGLRFLSS